MFKNRKKRKRFSNKSKKINAIDKSIKQCKIHYKTYRIQQLNETDLEKQSETNWKTNYKETIYHEKTLYYYVLKLR